MKKSALGQLGTKKTAFLWAKGLVSCLGLIFLMSHNAAAFQITENVTSKGYFSAPYWSYRSNSTWSATRNTSLSRSSSDPTITGVRLRSSTDTGVSVKAGDYIVVHGWATFTEAVYADNFRNITGYIGLSASTEPRNCNIINFDNSIQEYNTGTGNANGLQRFTFDVTCVVLSDNTFPSMNFYTRSNVSGVSGTTLTINFTGWDWYEPGSDQQKEENTANENIEQNETDSNSSSSDAEDASQSLISAIGGFVSAVTSASPSNCQINGNMGKFDMGNIDLCANPVPTYMQVISSLILICICIPFAIIMFNRFIALFRSFQQ